MKMLSLVLIGLLVAAAVSVGAATSDAALKGEPDGPRFTADGELMKPENYRQWVAIGTGLNMSYGPAGDSMNGEPPFTNVFVNPAAYRSFLQTGMWPDRTVFILEIRESIAVNNSRNGGNGYFQGDVIGIEAEVKDASRFPEKWAFFGLSPSGRSGAQIPAAASCYSCHAKNAAVENTFVQFYPVLRDVARDKGTYKVVPEVF